MKRVRQSSTFDWLIHAYFSDPASRILLKTGACLMEQGGYNDRLYLVRKGTLQGYMEYKDGSRVEILQVEVNSFIGVYSFFSGTYKSIATVEALEDSEVAYIGRQQLVIPSVQGNSLKEQFMPVAVADLMQRQQRMQEIAREKEQALKKLMEHQKLVSLGQMAAGIAHELNNAIAVLARNTNWLTEEYGANWLDPDYVPFFEGGLLRGRMLSSREVRNKKKELTSKYQLDEKSAESIAQAGIEPESLQNFGGDIPGMAGKIASAWELGATFRDMRIAADQSTHVVKSIKTLGTQNQYLQPDLNLNDSINNALSLLRHKLNHIDVQLQLNEIPEIRGNQGEFVQVWINLIRNACEAMNEQKERQPILIIKSEANDERIRISITDNGPGIPQDIQPRIFQPNTTTKVNGLSFGLGLGLSIVQKILVRYHVIINFETSDTGTTFIVDIPIGGRHGEN